MKVRELTEWLARFGDPEAELVFNDSDDAEREPVSIEYVSTAEPGKLILLPIWSGCGRAQPWFAEEAAS